MKDYKLKTKNDIARSLLDTIRPIKKFYCEGNTWLKVGNIGVHYGEKTARMEGFARIIWGLGPLWAGADDLTEDLQKEAEEWREFYLTGIINGSDPTHPAYWGKSYDYDQKLVEMAALVTAITLCPEKLWEPLTQPQKDNLYNFLNQTNTYKLHNNNWRYFRILVNMTFRVLDLPWDEENLKSDREIIEGCYMDDGWYYDGHMGQIDYYIPFAMEFYALIYSKVMKDKEPEYCETLRNRAIKFADDFVYWFGNDGNEIPYGRSLTYRFAHVAFFGAMGFAEAQGEKATYGVMKQLTVRNIENWLNRPIFDDSGAMSVGYGYPNIIMSERYNAGGSPYWAFKAYIMLSLSKDHPFWASEGEDFPYEEQKCFKHPSMLITHDDNDHVLSYVTSQHFPRRQGKSAEKYEKFVYSNQFGFSVSRDTEIVGGAFDSTLVASPAGEDDYKMRFGNVSACEVSEQSVRTNYRLIPDVFVKSIVVPCGAWHVRIHKITNAIKIDLAEGGFSIEAERCFNAISGDLSGKYTPEEIVTDETSAYAVLPWGISGVVSLTGEKPIVTDCMPNTNLLYNTTVLPMTMRTAEPGEYVMITCVFGDRSETAKEKMKQVPKVEICGDKFIIKANGKEITEEFLA